MLDATVLPLVDDQARLRLLRASDAPAFVEGTRDPAVRAYAHLPEPHYTTASVEEMLGGVVRDGLRRGDLAVLAIADTATDAFAGSLVVFDVTDARAEIGFWVHPRSRGAGMAGAAVGLGMRFAQRSGISTLTARTVTENRASQRVLIRCGFIETGRRPGATPSGEEIDLVHYECRLPARDGPHP